jgi:hypothetical protein
VVAHAYERHSSAMAPAPAKMDEPVVGPRSVVESEALVIVVLRV